MLKHCYIFVWTYQCVSCLNFWDEACWFLSLRVFGLLSSSLLLFPQRFSQYILRPSSGVCRTRGRSSKFREGFRVRQTPEEGRRTYRPKRYGNNNKDEDNSPKTLSDKNTRVFSLNSEYLPMPPTRQDLTQGQ